ncbi:RNA polymerase sigma factor [Hirschia litorea]|uniref:RNA polymerase sigma factor n=1 Tax=Hirschia litorea TaxID=1199156 RepID=A0ABW2IKM2_9PROT
MLPPYSLEQTIARIVREEWGRILSCIVKNVGDFQLAEDVLQDAVEAALKTWPEKGVPKSPAAWLITTSHRKAIDRLRRLNNFKKKQADIAYLSQLPVYDIEEDNALTIPDERLEMIFTCCHPALDEKTQIALTLRTIGGLKTEEIARAFLDTSSAMAQRLVRAKKKIKLAAIPYKIPDQQMMPSRLRGVLAVVYLIFNEGYSASSGENLTRVNLSNEAIRLARILVQLLPHEPEVLGLYALLLLHDARRYARLDKQGRMVALEHQDRSLWDQQKAEEGNHTVKQALAKGAVGPYQLQACISALHVGAADWESTDWPQICGLYALLYQMQPTPIVRINQAIALSYGSSLQAGIEVLHTLENTHDMTKNASFLLAKADVCERSGEVVPALRLLESALAFADNDIERAFVARKVESLRAAITSSSNK